MLIEFIKMTGAGNDFILIDNRKSKYNFQADKTILSLCDRHYGIGADGVLVIGESDKADFKMDYYNPDGTFGAMCGNGGRCAAMFYMESNNSTTANFESLGHIYKAVKKNDLNISLNMMDVKSFNIINIDVLFKYIIKAYFINTGAPHVIIFMDELPGEIVKMIKSDGINKIGSFIRDSDEFKPDGTNVDFIEIVGNSSVSMRTYERGVENETLACGTGAIASAVVAFGKKNLIKPVTVITKSNEILRVSFDQLNGGAINVELAGKAKIVFKGTINI